MRLIIRVIVKFYLNCNARDFYHHHPLDHLMNTFGVLKLALPDSSFRVSQEEGSFWPTLNLAQRVLFGFYVGPTLPSNVHVILVAPCGCGWSRQETWCLVPREPLNS